MGLKTITREAFDTQRAQSTEQMCQKRMTLAAQGNLLTTSTLNRRPVLINRASLVENRLERQRSTRIESRLDEMATTLRHILSELKKKQQ